MCACCDLVRWQKICHFLKLTWYFSRKTREILKVYYKHNRFNCLPSFKHPNPYF